MNIKDLARICYYAQSHSQDWDWSLPGHAKEYCFEHVSFVVACFIANDTKLGGDGCDWDVVLKELTGPVKTQEQWDSIIERLAQNYGGMS